MSSSPSLWTWCLLSVTIHLLSTWFFLFFLKKVTPYVRVSDTVLGQRQYPYLGTNLLEVAGHCSAFFWYLNTCQMLCKPMCRFVSLMSTLLTCGPPVNHSDLAWVWCVILEMPYWVCQALLSSIPAVRWDPRVFSGMRALYPEAMRILLSVSRVHFNAVVVLS